MNSPSPQDKKVAVIGSGLVGTLLTILLAEAGFSIDVYEKRKDPRIDTHTQGRSIALSLSDRGWKALRMVGLEEAVRGNTNPAYGRMVHQIDGVSLGQDYGDGSQAIHTINRNYLNTTLLEKAIATKQATFYFEHALENINGESGEIVVTNLSENERVTKRYDHIIGVDGVFSAVRKNLSEKNIWTFENSVLDFGYKELRISPNVPGHPALADHRVHVWPRKNSVLMAFPTTEGYFASTLFIPMIGEDSLASITSREKIMDFFKRQYNDVIPYISNLEDDFFRNPESILTQVKGWPWRYKDKILLMGDACHAVTPFYGMGMNIGFEDCVVFMDLLKENNYDLGKTFAPFEAARKPDTDAIFELSYKNFTSLNDSPDPAYQQKWLLERKIWKILPERWTPIYVLIVFSEKPLQGIPAIKERQDRILDNLVAAHPRILDMSDEALKELVEPLLLW